MLERSDRVCRIHLADFQSLDLEIFMQQLFPELTELWLMSNHEMSVIPDSFLGGSAPRLEFLQLTDIPFPRLPKLLLSATHLVKLHLVYIPHSSYITPNALAAALSALTRVEELSLQASSFNSNPLDLALTGQADVRLPHHVSYSPFSLILTSRVPVNIWMTLWPASMPSAQALGDYLFQ